MIIAEAFAGSPIADQQPAFVEGVGSMEDQPKSLQQLISDLLEIAMESKFDTEPVGTTVRCKDRSGSSTQFRRSSVLMSG